MDSYEGTTICGFTSSGDCTCGRYKRCHRAETINNFSFICSRLGLFPLYRKYRLSGWTVVLRPRILLDCLLPYGFWTYLLRPYRSPTFATAHRILMNHRWNSLSENICRIELKPKWIFEIAFIMACSNGWQLWRNRIMRTVRTISCDNFQSWRQLFILLTICSPFLYTSILCQILLNPVHRI